MNIQIASSDTVELPVLERSAYSFRAIASQVIRNDVGEKLVAASQLEKAGFSIEPFWEAQDDLEGECYKAYIAKNPDFTLSVREGVATRLTKAASLLPSHWQIVIKAGYRPLEVQLSLLEAMQNESRRKFPNRTNAEHLEHARTFVADPRIVCPPHTTGGAIDILLRDRRTGEDVDMGCAPNTDTDEAFLFSDVISTAARENRKQLLQAILAAGFAPNVNEWWHYQYGETYWAAFYGHKQTQYDLLNV